VFLAFDPAVSRHHEVFFFPTEKQEQQEEQHELSPTKGFKEKVFHVFVYSSRTGQWENREFMPSHSATGDLYDVVTTPCAKDERTWWSAEYWHGSLYVHCHSNVLIIIRCSQGTYDMVRLPGNPSVDRETLYQGELPNRCLASYEKGIRYVVINDELELDLWERTESTLGQLGWTLAHQANLKEYDDRRIIDMRNKPMRKWAVVESNNDLINLFEYYSNEESNADLDDEEEEGPYNSDVAKGEGQEEQYTYDAGEDEEVRSSNGSDDSWNSDLHNFIDFDKTTIEDQDGPVWSCSIIGFHPYKDVLLLKFMDTVVAYHLHTSRLQSLGYIHPHKHQSLGYIHPHKHHQEDEVYIAFPYRPCYIDALPSRKATR
jgi:hypothetical protein